MTAAELRKASTEDLLGALEHPPTSFEEYLDLHAGKAEATVWTDDLTHEYVHINADYES